MTETTKAPRTNTEDLHQFLDWYTQKIGAVHPITEDTFDCLEQKFTFFKS